jgi:hemin uptake protein HemP
VSALPGPRRLAEVSIPSYDARDLTGACCRAEIVLDGARYLLRITRAGKLILTK